ncbi:MAG: zinc ribbon domain-containing protein [Deltaproteobacteria bacterium]|nr:zinc ribbon domain-containing protein [Deltaproteobacteria bacterium]
MPIYEYVCKSCGMEFEVTQKISDEPLKECQRCSSNKIEKVISPSAFVLKGSGWHKSDYASKVNDPSKKSPEKDSSCPAASSSSSACSTCPQA